MLLKLLASRKWTFTLLVLIGGGVAFFFGKISKQELLALFQWIGGPTLIATGLEGIGPSNGTTPPAAPSSAPSAGSSAP